MPLLFRENPEIPCSPEALTTTEKRLPPPSRKPTPTPRLPSHVSYLATFALFRNCCPHHLGRGRMFCGSKKGEVVIQRPSERAPTSSSPSSLPHATKQPAGSHRQKTWRTKGHTLKLHFLKESWRVRSWKKQAAKTPGIQHWSLRALNLLCKGD